MRRIDFESAQVLVRPNVRFNLRAGDSLLRTRAAQFQRSQARELCRQAKKIRTAKKKEALLCQATTIQKRSDVRLVSPGGSGTRAQALEHAKWKSDQKDLEREDFKLGSKLGRRRGSQ